MGIAFLPQSDPDFSDLDVRDAQNRPICSPTANGELAALFRENLLNLTLYAAPHAMAEAYSIAEAFSRLFNSLIFSRVPRVLDAFLEAILPSSRRFVHNVHNLGIIFSVGVFVIFSLLAARCSVRAPLRINLRC